MECSMPISTQCLTTHFLVVADSTNKVVEDNGGGQDTPMEAENKPVGKIWFSIKWCLPSLLGFLAFSVAFPIDRYIPHWFPVNLAILFTLWFLFVTPVTTVIAIATLLKRNRICRMSPFIKLLAWAAISGSIVLNALFLLAGWASTY
jgi:hypothetical protein